MCSRFYLDTMHVDLANLIMQYLSIRWSDLKTGNTVATVRISRSFLWYVINDMMHVIQIKNDACNARKKLMHVMQLWFFGYMDDHLSHSPWLNYGCKFGCLHYVCVFSLSNKMMSHNFHYATTFYLKIIWHHFIGQTKYAW